MTTCNAAAVSTLAKATHTALICARHFALVQCDRTARRPTDHGPIRLDRTRCHHALDSVPRIHGGSPRDDPRIRDHAGRSTDTRSPHPRIRDAIHGYAIMLGDPRIRDYTITLGDPLDCSGSTGRSTNTRFQRYTIHGAIHGYAIAAIHMRVPRIYEYAIVADPRGDPRIRDFSGTRSTGRSTDTRLRVPRIHEYAIAAVHMACHGYAIACTADPRIRDCSGTHGVSRIRDATVHMGIRDAADPMRVPLPRGAPPRSGRGVLFRADDARSADARVGFSTYGTRCAVPS